MVVSLLPIQSILNRKTTMMPPILQCTESDLIGVALQAEPRPSVHQARPWMGSTVLALSAVWPLRKALDTGTPFLPVMVAARMAMWVDFPQKTICFQQWKDVV